MFKYRQEERIKSDTKRKDIKDCNQKAPGKNLVRRRRNKDQEAEKKLITCIKGNYNFKFLNL